MLKDILRKKLEERGLSSRDAAKVIGVSHTTIIRIIRGEMVDLDTVVKIAEWMKVKPATLVNIGSSGDEVKPDKVIAVLEGNPRLLQVFSAALDAIQKGDVSIDIIDDIASYAVYKINIYRDQQIEINTKIKTDEEISKVDKKDYF